ncbi:MAG: antibiotic biosynthesis monooxygenase family protein [Actinomycetota bacterium]
MFVAVVTFPTVPEDREADFLAWFDWSNEVLAGSEGLVSRRLLAPKEAGAPYTALVEHESEATFAAMHTGAAREQVHQRLRTVLAEGSPSARFYDVVVASAPAGCCGGRGNGHQHEHGAGHEHGGGHGGGCAHHGSDG